MEPTIPASVADFSPASRIRLSIKQRKWGLESIPLAKPRYSLVLSIDRDCYHFKSDLVSKAAQELRRDVKLQSVHSKNTLISPFTRHIRIGIS